MLSHSLSLLSTTTVSFAGLSVWSVRVEVSPLNVTISNVNESAQFTCTVTGYSNFSMEWVKVASGYKRVSSTQNTDSATSILTVSGASEGGKYRCVVTKSAGDEVFRTVYVYGYLLY